MRRHYLRTWFGFLDGREPSQELADAFATELAAKHSELAARKIRGTVNVFLRKSATESGATPIVVIPPPRHT